MLSHYGGVWAKITRLGFPGLVAAVKFASVAQSVEQRLCNAMVAGSIPAIGSNI